MFLITSLLVTFLAGYPDGVRCGSHHETTIYVDTVLRLSLQTQLQNNSLDPHPMPGFEIRSQSDHHITVKGNFSQGRMHGLAKIYRIGQCGGPAFNAQGNVTFNCTLGLDKLNLTYSTKIKYGVLPSSTSTVVANLTRPFGMMEVTSSPRGTSPALSRFTVATLGQFDHDISGGLLKGEFPHLRHGFTHKIINDVQQVLLGTFTNALAQAVAQTPLPSGLAN